MRSPGSALRTEEPAIAGSPTTRKLFANNAAGYVLPPTAYPNRPGAFGTAAPMTVLLATPLLITCTLAPPSMTAPGTWNETCVGLTKYTAAGRLFTRTCVPLNEVGRLLA